MRDGGTVGRAGRTGGIVRAPAVARLKCDTAGQVERPTAPQRKAETPLPSSCRRRLLAITAVATGAAALPAPAAASDETLRQEIQAVFVELRPALEAFRVAAERVEDAPDTGELQGATDRLRDGLRRYKWGVVNRKASSRRGLAAKRQLLAGIRQFDLGLIQYQRALVRLDAGASRRSILSALRTADRRITEAAQDEAEGLEALGVPATP